jgi:hypothetical protein
MRASHALRSESSPLLTKEEGSRWSSWKLPSAAFLGIAGLAAVVGATFTARGGDFALGSASTNTPDIPETLPHGFKKALLGYKWSPGELYHQTFLSDNLVPEGGCDNVNCGEHQYDVGQFEYVANCLGGGSGCIGVNKGCRLCTINPEQVGTPSEWLPACPKCVCEEHELDPQLCLGYESPEAGDVEDQESYYERIAEEAMITESLESGAGSDSSSEPSAVSEGSDSGSESSSDSSSSPAVSEGSDSGSESSSDSSSSPAVSEPEPSLGGYWEVSKALDANERWREVAVSDDGTKVAATSWIGAITTWDPANPTVKSRVDPTDLYLYYALGMSADGSKIAAGSFHKEVVLSENGGVSYRKLAIPNGKSNPSTGQWYQFAYSRDFSVFVAPDAESGDVWISRDLFQTWTRWTPDVPLEQKKWSGAAASDDGTRLALSAHNGGIWISGDAGVTWTQADPDQVGSERKFLRMASSADGAKLACVVNDGYILISDDYGANWRNAASAGERSWHAVAMSGDGNKLVATMEYSFKGEPKIPGVLWTSFDGGVTWHENDCGDAGDPKCAQKRRYLGIAASRDFENIYAVVNEGEIWKLDEWHTL